MAITSSNLNITISRYTGNIHHLTIGHDETGDASGGNVQFTYHIGSASELKQLFSKNLFYTLENVNIYNNDNTNNPTAIFLMQLQAFNLIPNDNLYNEFPQPMNPHDRNIRLLLGRPLLSGAGLIKVIWGTNTNAKTYRFTAKFTGHPKP